jgi:nicotinate (nicotinamide) nucleotide adenylyltransferase
MKLYPFFFATYAGHIATTTHSTIPMLIKPTIIKTTPWLYFSSYTPYTGKTIAWSWYNQHMHNRIGLYPGTFDPIHIGHVSFALTAISTCKLDKIIILPEKLTRTKQTASDFDTRVQRIEAATANYPNIETTVLKTMPITVHTEQAELGYIFEDNEVVLLMGTDVLRNLEHWQDISLLLENHELCIGIREDDTPYVVAEYISQLERSLGTRIKYTTITTQHKNISSTKIRSQNNKVSK